MNFSKPKPNATQPVIRKTVVRVPVTKSANASSSSPAPQRPAARPNPNRFQQALERTSVKSSVSRKVANPAKRALSVSRGVKRKSATPQPPGPRFSSDDEDYSDGIGGSDSDASRKRIKSSVSSVESTGPRRNVISEKAFQDANVLDFVHGADATSGVYANKYKNPWDHDDFECTELQYPSKSQRERFELKFPKNYDDDYRPTDDIPATIKSICTFYLPDPLRQQCLDEDTGYERRFASTWPRHNMVEFVEIIQDFNSLLKKAIDDGTVRKELLATRRLHLDWVNRILEQIYARTVSPKVESLRAYENGTDNVYGELLPRFCSDIFGKTNLNHEQVFIDLGSGVGNVVLQAALEVGCESWGIEMMKNPCDLAELQAKEFPARTRLWGLSAGEVKLLRGDFTNHPEIPGVLKRADVVLVNNQAFTPELNANLRDMFYDLKEGCQVVSLKPFIAEGHKIATHNVNSADNFFVQKRFEYFSNSVSWTDREGPYYIATKDRRPLDAFLDKNPRLKKY